MHDLIFGAVRGMKYAFLAITMLMFLHGSALAVSTSQSWSTGDLEYTVADSFDLILIEDCLLLQEVGKPELPVKYIRLLLPTGNDATSLSISNKTTTRLDTTLNIRPAQEPIKPIDPNDTTWSWTDPDSATYNSASGYPSSSAEIVSQGYFDGKNKIVTIAVYPITYYPAIDSLDLATSITVTVNYSSGTAGFQPDYRQFHLQQIYDDLLNGMVENYGDITSYQEKPTTVDYSMVLMPSPPDVSFYPYTIITHDSLKNAGYFDELVDWLTRRGFEAGVVDYQEIRSVYTNGDLTSGINDEAGSIREYLKDAYEDHGVTWALLGGITDASEVKVNCPARFARSSEFPADWYFAEFNADWEVNSNSIYGENDPREWEKDQEIWVGRIPAINGEDIANWIEKVLSYEQHPGCGDYDYLSEAFIEVADECQREEEEKIVSAHFDFTFFDTTVFRNHHIYSLTGK